MDTLEAIATRRSIRKYQKASLDENQLTTVLKAAMDAPSALDQQPWHFVVITEPDKLASIPTVHSHSDLVKDAPACILVCFDPSLEKLPGFWPQDCAAATQNLLIAAHACGLGAVWIGVYPDESNQKGLGKLLNIPETVTPFALVALGIPDEPYPEKKNFKADRIHTNGW